MKMKTSKRKNTIGSVLANLAGKSLLAAAAFALVGASTVQAMWVTIGNPGNDAQSVDNRDHTEHGGDGWGAVSYTYLISATAVSIAEFTASGVGSGGEDHWNDGVRTVGTDAPATYMSLAEAKKYANYLTEQQHGNSTYNLYNTAGTDASGTYTRSDAISDGKIVYAIPTEDEWYKAAYYDGDNEKYTLYANGTDTAPLKSGVGDTDLGSTGWNYDNALDPSQPWTVDKGTMEQNDTRNMMGNVWEWQEDTVGVLRGGNYNGPATNMRASYRYAHYDPTAVHGDVGFRVAAIPEPASGALFLLVGGVVWFVRRKLRA